MFRLAPGNTEVKGLVWQRRIVVVRDIGSKQSREGEREEGW